MDLLVLVLGMALVTYLPRMLPLVLLQNVELPSFVRQFMKYIPYAALGALIFPGILSSTGNEHIESAIVGCGLSVILAWFEMNLIFVVLGGVVGATLVHGMLYGWL